MRPMVSFVVPSRERPELLRQSIASLGEGDFEVIVRIDDDDPLLGGYLDLDQVIVGPRHGYGALQNYYDELAAQARGDWLFLWNDDALMRTPDWLDVVGSYDGRMV